MMKVIECTCKHEYQDKKYGKGKRQMNSTLKEGLYRCTICGKEVRTNEK